MQRRMFCRALTGLATLATGGLALAAPAGTADIGPDPYFKAFASQLEREPWTMGYEGLQGDAAAMPLRLTGRLPGDLRGAFYRNGPARHALGGYRYHHYFDGDGMVQRYAITDAGVSHTGRFVRTDKFKADSAAGRPVRASFGSNPPGAEFADSADSINVANTSLLRLGNGQMLALWEGGSATRIDAATLQTLGLQTWRGDLAGMPFSAHPKVESDGTVWNFGVSAAAGLLTLYRIDADGQLLQATTFPVPQLAMVHDFAVTQRFLILPLPPFVFDRERAQDGATFLDSYVWKPELGLRLLVVPKDGPDKPRWFTLPAGFVFHVANAWEDADGSSLHLDLVRSDDASMVQDGFKSLMRGEFHGSSQPRLSLITLDLKSGTARQAVQPWIAEFPRVDPRLVARRHRQIYTTLRIDPGPRPGFDAIVRFDRERGTLDRYRYGEQVMVEEHLFVPRTGAGEDGAGWVLGTALDLRQRAMLFSVFDAMHLADGPIAQGTLPRVMPLGLHGLWA
ncbi:MAG: carotenoid oxygenase family protein [Burkholderiales bacterium]|nr:carotenoid oxygenase family protein [Burkholderiales bacterium]